MIISHEEGAVITKTSIEGYVDYLQLNDNGDWAFTSDVRESYFFYDKNAAEDFLKRNEFTDDENARYRVKNIKSTFSYELS
jgi:hypothetical protein